MEAWPEMSDILHTINSLACLARYFLFSSSSLKNSTFLTLRGDIIFSFLVLDEESGEEQLLELSDELPDESSTCPTKAYIPSAVRHSTIFSNSVLKNRIVSKSVEDLLDKHFGLLMYF